MRTDYEELVPKGVIFSLKQIEEMGIIKVATMKKLIGKREIEYVKVGNKIFVSRQEIIEYLRKNTIPTIDDTRSFYAA